MNRSGISEFPDSPQWRFFYCVLVSFLLLVLSLLGAKLFAKTALVTFCLISVCYSTWIFSVIFRGAGEMGIPKVRSLPFSFIGLFQVNTAAYRVPENASDPASPLIVNFDQNITATYTGFR